MPVEEAQYVIVIASKTGWSEHFIRWDLPLSRGWAYYHGARLLEGERCIWPETRQAAAEWLLGIRSKLPPRKPIDHHGQDNRNATNS